MRKLIAKLAVVALAFLSCGVAWAAPARTLVRIEVPGAKNLQFFNLWVALGAGFFQQEGLEPRIVVDAAPRSAGELLFKGDAEVALLPPPMFLGMMAEEKPIMLFVNLLANEPIDLVVRGDVAAARGMSSRGALRERLQAMKGLKVGLASEVGPRLRALFASVGMNAGDDLQLVTVAGPDQVQAFADGRVDALFAHTPYLETALVRYRGVLVADNSGGEVPMLANGQIHALATTRSLAREKPAGMAAVARAIYRAQQLIHSDSEGTVNALIASGVTAPDRRLIEAITAIYAPAVPRTPAVSLEGIERDAALYPAHPRAPDFARVKAADFVAAEFARKAVEP